MSPQKFGGVSGGMAVVGGEKRGKKRGVSDLGRCRCCGVVVGSG